MHVDEHVVDLAELAERDLDLGERRAPGAQVEVAAEVHDAEAHAVVLHDAAAAARLAAQEVRGAHDPLVRVEVGVDLAAVVGVVAERDRVDARGEHLVGVLGRDPEPARGVLAVDHHERRLVALAQEREAVEQRVAPEAADDVADEQDAHRPSPSPRGSATASRAPVEPWDACDSAILRRWREGREQASAEEPRPREASAEPRSSS